MKEFNMFHEKVAADEGLQGIFETDAELSGEIACDLKTEIDALKDKLDALKLAYRVYHGFEKAGLQSKEEIAEAMYAEAMKETKKKKSEYVAPMLAEAAKLGYTPALLEYARALVYADYGLERDVERGLKLLREEAENGSSDACYLFVTIHKDYPQYVGPDIAYEMCARAAASGHPKAIKRLKKPFEMSQETQSLIARAQKGEKGVNFALSLRGDLTIDDREKYFRLALEEGDQAAEYEMGKIMRDSGNIEEAMRYLQRAVDHGNALACFTLARVILNGKPHFYHGDGTPDRNDADYQKEFELMSRAAELGDYRGLCIMGRAYVRGYMVDKDYDKAREYLQKAFDMGERLSAPRLIAETYRYTDAPGTAEKAVEYYKMSADAGNRSAMLGLMDIYEDGLREVAKDSSKAAYYRYLAEDHF
ncbi:MAG: tetratricopeptide repeat protein [Bacilli bacterium]|nr:tetratricopeptide repeat protein [Bacilli bacterium]